MPLVITNKYFYFLPIFFFFTFGIKISLTIRQLDPTTKQKQQKKSIQQKRYHDMSRKLVFLQRDGEKRNTLNGMADKIICVLRKNPCLFFKLMIEVYKFIH